MQPALSIFTFFVSIVELIGDIKTSTGILPLSYQTLMIKRGSDKRSANFGGRRLVSSQFSWTTRRNLNHLFQPLQRVFPVGIVSEAPRGK